jgi:uncharacterized protein YjbI with pentapeptide repeats
MSFWSQTRKQFDKFSDWLKTSNSAANVIRVAEVLGKLTIFVGIITFIVETPERSRERHYQAWQLLNGATGHRGEAGRSIALDVLIRDHQEIRRLDLSNADLRNFDLRSALMPSIIVNHDASFFNVDFSCRGGFRLEEYYVPTFRWCWESHLENGTFEASEINKANFNDANLADSKFGAIPESTLDRIAAYITESSFDRAILSRMQFHNTYSQNNSFNSATFKDVCDTSKHETEDLCPVRWTHITFKGKNSFNAADLSNARWIDVKFELDENRARADFTDANLSGILVSAEVVPVWHTLSESTDKDLLQNVTLCRTKFSTGESRRDCKE